MIEREDRAVFTEQLQHRRRGRPRTATPKVLTTISVPADLYDSFCRQAALERKTLHAFLSQRLESSVR